MSSWGGWDWIGWIVMGLAAADIAMKDSKYPWLAKLHNWKYWKFVPLFLFVLGSMIFALEHRGIIGALKPTQPIPIASVDIQPTSAPQQSASLPQAVPLGKKTAAQVESKKSTQIAKPPISAPPVMNWLFSGSMR